MLRVVERKRREAKKRNSVGHARIGCNQECFAEEVATEAHREPKAGIPWGFYHLEGEVTKQMAKNSKANKIALAEQKGIKPGSTISFGKGRNNREVDYVGGNGNVYLKGGGRCLPSDCEVVS